MKKDEAAIFFALVKKILTTEIAGLTILIKNTETPNKLRNENNITERIMQIGQFLHN